MRTFWDDRQRGHAPGFEFFNGALHPSAEHPGRVDAILAVVGATEPVEDHGRVPLLRVHHADYLDFLEGAHGEWLAAGRTGDALPYAFPVQRRVLDLSRVDARLGQYSYDTCAPISAGTWQAVYWAAQTGLSALVAVLGGEHAFALTRPPGHHAGAAFMGGYSYINVAAVCAAEAAARGRRTAILDIDYHAGNGTQDIVASHPDLRFASIHADPATDYPYFWGQAGDGTDNVLNLPLPRGTEFAAYDDALARAIAWLAEGSPDLLVLSFGADTFEGDPISHFAIHTDDYRQLAARIAAMGLPTLVVMEGGYAVDALGANVAAFLSGF
jgi:acetoin utilization deacetylase AcuC-like enzyme